MNASRVQRRIKTQAKPLSQRKIEIDMEALGSTGTIEDKFINTEVDGIEEEAHEVENAPDLNARIAETRREKRSETRGRRRISMVGRDVLRFPDRPGYVRRVVNDVSDGERVKMFQEAGWEIVRTPGINGGDTRAGADSQLGSVVCRSVGGGIKGVLMEIPEEWYNEDQREKAKIVDRTEDEVRRKKVSARDAGADGVYGEVDIGFHQ